MRHRWDLTSILLEITFSGHSSHSKWSQTSSTCSNISMIRALAFRWSSSSHQRSSSSRQHFFISLAASHHSSIKWRTISSGMATFHAVFFSHTMMKISKFWILWLEWVLWRLLIGASMHSKWKNYPYIMHSRSVTTARINGGIAPAWPFHFPMWTPHFLNFPIAFLLRVQFWSVTLILSSLRFVLISPHMWSLVATEPNSD